MTTRTIHICDRCKAEQVDNYDGLHTVTLSVKPLMRYSANSSSNDHSETWCRKCVDDVGLLRFVPFIEEEAKKEPPLPTLEEMIREIVRDEAQATVEQALARQ